MASDCSSRRLEKRYDRVASRLNKRREEEWHMVSFRAEHLPRRQQGYAPYVFACGSVSLKSVSQFKGVENVCSVAKMLSTPQQLPKTRT